jgi:hypothetical protein
LSKPFRSDKRKKELLRLKKQEEKRQRRFGLIKPENSDDTGESVIEGEDGAPEGSDTATESDQPEVVTPETGPSEA